MGRRLLLADHGSRTEARTFRLQRVRHILGQLSSEDPAAMTWTLLEKTDRTPAQDDEMLHAAHASRYHWGEIGDPVNLARGEWQCSRVYAILGRAEPALWHARRCLEIDEANGLGDWAGRT